MKNGSAVRTSTTHKEMFFHVPLIGHPRFRYKTVFARLEHGGFWHSGVAYCVRADQFSRSIGRHHARTRYFAKRNGFLIGRQAINASAPSRDGKYYPSFQDAMMVDIVDVGFETHIYLKDPQAMADDADLCQVIALRRAGRDNIPHRQRFSNAITLGGEGDFCPF